MYSSKFPAVGSCIFPLFVLLLWLLSAPNMSGQQHITQQSSQNPPSRVSILLHENQPTPTLSYAETQKHIESLRQSSFLIQLQIIRRGVLLLFKVLARHIDFHSPQACNPQAHGRIFRCSALDHLWCRVCLPGCTLDKSRRRFICSRCKYSI